MREVEKQPTLMPASRSFFASAMRSFNNPSFPKFMMNTSVSFPLVTSLLCFIFIASRL